MLHALQFLSHSGNSVAAAGGAWESAVTDGCVCLSGYKVTWVSSSDVDTPLLLPTCLFFLLINLFG